jgi:hypothetical protein
VDLGTDDRPRAQVARRRLPPLAIDRTARWSLAIDCKTAVTLVTGLSATPPHHCENRGNSAFFGNRRGVMTVRADFSLLSIATLVAVVCIVAWQLLGTNLSTSFGNLATSV